MALILDVVLLVGLVAGAVALGRIVTRGTGLASGARFEQVLIAAGCGLAAVAYFTVLLAALGALYSAAAYALLAAGLIALVALAVRSRRRPRLGLPRPSDLQTLVLAALCVFALLNLLTVLSPPTDYDGLDCHLEIPKRYIAAHGFVYLPNGHSNYPQFAESLYTFAMLLNNDVLARLLNLMLGLLATGAVYSVGRRFAGRTPALLAALIFLGSTLTGYIFTGMFVEGVQTFYALLAILAMLSWIDTGQRRWLWLAAAFVGVCLGIKLNSVVLLLVLVWALFERAMRIDRGRLWAVLRLAVAATGIAVAFPLPWLIKNAIYVGDPFFPALSELLDRWGEGMAAANWGLYGFGFGVVDYLLLPVRVAIRPLAFGSPFTAPVLLVLTPLLVGLVRAPRMVRWLTAVVLLWFVFWANNAGQSLRFFLPGLALYGVVLAVCAERLSTSPAAKRRWAQAFLVVVTLGGAVLNLALLGPSGQLDAIGRSLSFIAGQSRDDFLTEHLDIYPVAGFVNDRLPVGTIVASVWEERSYPFDRPLIHSHSPEGAFVHGFRLDDDPEALALAMLSRGITHLILNENIRDWDEFRLRDLYMYGIDSNELLVYDRTFRACCLRPLFTHERITLYEVRRPARAPVLIAADGS